MKTKEKVERTSKQKLLKGCHQGQNVTVLATLKSISPALLKTLC